MERTVHNFTFCTCKNAVKSFKVEENCLYYRSYELSKSIRIYNQMGALQAYALHVHVHPDHMNQETRGNHKNIVQGRISDRESRYTKQQNNTEKVREQPGLH